MTPDDNKRKAYMYLADLATRQGYILFDSIIDASEEYQLSALDVDWLSNSLLMNGVLVYDERPDIHTDKSGKDDDYNDYNDYNDYAQCDYDSIFYRIIQLEPALKFLVNAVRTIRPPQFKEVSNIMTHAKEGNKHARDRIIEMHIRSALRIGLQRALLYDTDLIDCIGDACEGLIMATDKYDPSTSGPFLSYASMWIYQRISRGQPNKRPSVYYPVHKKDLYFSAYPKLKNCGCTICERAYSCQKIKHIIREQSNCSERDVDETILQMIPLYSYDVMLRSIDNEFDDSLDKYFFVERITTDNAGVEKVEYEDFQKEMDTAINSLTEREQVVIRKRFGFGYDEEKTLEDIGSELKVTRERVRQIESSALKKLRRKDNLKSLYDDCM